MPSVTAVIATAMNRFACAKMPSPAMNMNQMAYSGRMLMRPIPKASYMDRPRVKPLAFRANASSSAINSPSVLDDPTMGVASCPPGCSTSLSGPRGSGGN